MLGFGSLEQAHPFDGFKGMFFFFFGGGDGGGRIYENDMMYVIIFCYYMYILFFSLKHGLSQRRFEKCFVC